jgi:hypothetical protein
MRLDLVCTGSATNRTPNAAQTRLMDRSVAVHQPSEFLSAFLTAIIRSAIKDVKLPPGETDCRAML